MCQDRDKKDKRVIQTGFYRPVSLNGNTKSDQFRDAGRFFLLCSGATGGSPQESKAGGGAPEVLRCK